MNTDSLCVTLIHLYMHGAFIQLTLTEGLHCTNHHAGQWGCCTQYYPPSSFLPKWIEISIQFSYSKQPSPSSSSLPYSSFPISSSLPNPAVKYLLYSSPSLLSTATIFGGTYSISCQDNGGYLLPVIHVASTLPAPTSSYFKPFLNSEFSLCESIKSSG